MDQAGSGHYSILIVDEIAKNIQLLGNVLRKEGYVLSFAASGAQALEMVQSDSFDLILLDLMMPQMDGFQVCAKLKDLPKAREIPVIFLTAKTVEEDIVKGFQLGAVDYVTKPFRPEELIARVRTHLELKTSKDIIRRRNEELQLRNRRLDQLNQELIRALNEIKTLRGFLPICSHCKKIRRENTDPFEEESWVTLEKYITEHTEAMLTHGMCPQCMKKLYPDFPIKQ